MPKELTKADLAVYTVTSLTDHLPEKILATYAVCDGAAPGFVQFKDHEHKTVLLVNQQTVASIRREGSEIMRAATVTAIDVDHGPGNRAHEVSLEFSDGTVHVYPVTVTAARLDAPGSRLELGPRMPGATLDLARSPVV